MTKLRRKIVFTVFISATLVFALTVAIVGTFMHLNNINTADKLTDIINHNGGKIPLKRSYDKLSEAERASFYNFDEESPYRIRYFVVFYDSDGNVKSVDVEHIAAVDEDDAKKLAEAVRKNATDTGYYNDYRYRVSDETNTVVFIDFSDEIDGVRVIVLVISIVALIFILLITIVFYFLSRRAVRPFEENSRMQKQFITDASHELKTPLAIISANAEVLAYKDGENDWIKNITAQVGRIGGLINELLVLSRLEEIETNVDIEPLNFSEVINNTADDFAEVFKGKNVTVKREIQPDISLNGNHDQLKRLVSVLVENASKYVSEGGEVELKLNKELRHLTFTVFNTCEVDKNADYKHLFDRFYRPDSSRTSQTGGHGIGLSIAKRIVVLHNGTIEAIPEENGLRFKVHLSTKLKTGKKKKN